MSIDLIHDDVINFAQNYSGDLFHALICDSPYELGFMGKDWDKSGIAFNPDTWKAFYPLLHPGAFGMTFGSSRGWHRLACAIEDAGYIIHPTIFLWAQGQGFPKATKIKDDRFDGHRYGLQALKPAVEPIIVFQKPYEGSKSIDCITATGAGALNIDAARIATGERVQASAGAVGFGAGRDDKYQLGTGREYQNMGRWPANLILDEHAAAALDAQSGKTSRGHFPNGSKRTSDKTTIIYGKFNGNESPEKYMNDSGGASRFFYTVQSQLDDTDPVRYVAKANRSERDAGLDERCTHPTVKPIDLCRYLSTLLLPPIEYSPRRILIPFAGVASEMIGAILSRWEDVIGIEREKEYIDIGLKRIEHWTRQERLI